MSILKNWLKDFKKEVVEQKKVETVVTKKNSKPDEITLRVLNKMKFKLNGMGIEHNIDDNWKVLSMEIYKLCIKNNIQDQFLDVLDNFISAAVTKISFENRNNIVSLFGIIEHLDILLNYGILVEDVEELKNKIDSLVSHTKLKKI